jgi:hypothetical protein
MGVDSIILNNEDLYCKTLNIGISVDDIMAEFNAFDWLELRIKNTNEIFADFKNRLNFENKKDKYYSIKEKAFAYKFERAIVNLSAIVEEVNSSYNIASKGGISNEHLQKYYYIKYWADKKNIPVDYNDQNYSNRKLFNFYTILFDIFAIKLDNFNTNANIKNN